MYEETCYNCVYYTGEECDGYSREGDEVYDDTPACEDYIEKVI